MEPITIDLTTILDVINGLGTLGVMGVLVYWFMRGDILSRQVYEKLSQSMIDRTIEKVLESLHLDKK
jgi:hypothetical protein